MMDLDNYNLAWLRSVGRVLLGALFVISGGLKRLPTFHRSIRKRQREAPKFYLFDLNEH